MKNIVVLLMLIITGIVHKENIGIMHGSWLVLVRWGWWWVLIFQCETLLISFIWRDIYIYTFWHSYNFESINRLYQLRNHHSHQQNWHYQNAHRPMIIHKIHMSPVTLSQIIYKSINVNHTPTMNIVIHLQSIESGMQHNVNGGKERGCMLARVRWERKMVGQRRRWNLLYKVQWILLYRVQRYLRLTSLPNPQLVLVAVLAFPNRQVLVDNQVTNEPLWVKNFVSRISLYCYCQTCSS